MTEKKTPAIAVPVTYHSRPEPKILPHELQGRILNVLSQPGQHSNETLAGLLKEVIELASAAQKPAESVVTASAEGGRTVSGLDCSFCGKNRSEVRKLIGGQGGSICNECVALCNELVAED
jgi:hypothetical protein